MRGKLYERSFGIRPALEMISESLVAAFRKRRAATPQSSLLSAIRESHPSEKLRLGVCGIVHPEKQDIGDGSPYRKASEIADCFCTSV